MKRLIGCALIAVLTLTAVQVFAGGGAQGKAKKPSVIFVNVGSNLPYPASTQRAFEEFSKAKGWDYTVLDGQFDMNTNVKNMEQATVMKPDVIVVMVMDTTIQSGSMRAAVKAGIPVVLDTGRPDPADAPYFGAYCGVNDIIAGNMGAELIYEALGGKGRIVTIEGLPGQQTTEDRNKGFNERLKELGGSIEILSRNTGEWAKEKATKVMADYLTRYKNDIDGVWAQDDESAAGAALAIKEAGIPKGKIKIIGTGGSKTGLQGVVDGEIYGTCYQSPRTTMSLSIEAVDYIIKNKVPAGKNLDPFWRWIDLPKVTKDNVQKFLPGEW